MTDVSDLDSYADYHLAPHMVVFSHGFGVERTSRGLFSDITKALPDDWGYVLFDYNVTEGTTVTLQSLADQKQRLLAVITWLSQQTVVKQISLVAHSMGCITAALAEASELTNVVMLAPPLVMGAHSREYFTSKPGASLQDNVWRVPRRDGTISYIPTTLLDEIETIDAPQVLLDYASVQPYALIIPSDDEVLGDTDYNELALNENITAQTIDGAGHNFDGVAREAVVRAVCTSLL